MSEQVLKVVRRGHILIVVLCRPDRSNALGRDMVTALHETIMAAREERDIRVLVITGAGDRAFCAGADLKERAAMNEEEVREFVAFLRATFSLIYHFPLVTIAAIQGAAIGGGLELALACDLRYARRGVSLALSETRLAIIPGAGGTQLLPRLIGPARAKEMIFSAAPLDADEAERIGLVNRVFDAENFHEQVIAEAEKIAANGPIALEQAKCAIHLGMETRFSEGLEIEGRCYDQVIPTHDRLEGLLAFKEKRRPTYKGK